MPSPKARIATSEAPRIQALAEPGRKCTSTSKPMWKFSRTPTAAPRKMNQLITMIDAASVQLGEALST